MPDNNLVLVKKRLKNMQVSKRNPVYNSHLYWSQKAFSVTDALISELTNEGATIFDPFMGSGVTLIEAVSDKNKRNAIGVDINEVPLFIVDTVLGHYNARKINKVIDLYVKECKRLCEKLYLTSIDGSEAVISYTLFDRVGSNFIIKKINCIDKKTGKRVAKKPNESDLKLLKTKKKIENINDNILLENSKIAVKKGQKISDIFTPRNFSALDIMVGVMENEQFKEYQNIIKYVLLSMIHLCKITDMHSNSQWPLWTPKMNCVEKNAVFILERRAKLVKQALVYLEKNYKNSTKQNDPRKFKGNCNFSIIKKPIQKITQKDIPDNSIDLIITDPPYLGQVIYSEYMQLYESFLGFKINYEDEIVVSSSPERKKDVSTYFELIEAGFAICAKKLKQSRYMCMYFHDCSLDVWDKLISILNKNGLRFLSLVHIEKTSTLKNIISPKKSLNGDALLFFVKDKSVIKLSDGKESLPSIVYSVVKEAKHMIDSNGGKITTPELYDNGLMEIIINNGWLHPLAVRYKSLVEIFDEFLIWDEKAGYWTYN